MEMYINRKRLASAVTIHLLNKRDYHIYLLHRDYDSYYNSPWHWNDYIKINKNIELRNIHARTHEFDGLDLIGGLGGFAFRKYLYLSFDLYINDELIREYKACLSLNLGKNDFGYWEVENIDPDKDKINKEIPQWAVHQITAWVEKMRCKYN